MTISQFGVNFIMSIFSHSVLGIPLTFLPWMAPAVGEVSDPLGICRGPCGHPLRCKIFAGCWALLVLPDTGLCRISQVPAVFLHGVHLAFCTAPFITAGGPPGPLSCPVCSNLARLGREGGVCLCPLLRQVMQSFSS